MADRVFIWRAPTERSQWPISPPGLCPIELDNEAQEKIRSYLKDSDSDRIDYFIECAVWILSTIRWQRCFRKFSDGELDKIERIHAAVTRLIKRIEDVKDDTRQYLDLGLVGFKNNDISTFLQNYRSRIAQVLSGSSLSDRPGPKGGRPKKKKQVLAIRALAHAYRNVIEGRPSSADESRFHRIIAALMPALNEKTTNPRHLINLALKQ